MLAWRQSGVQVGHGFLNGNVPASSFTGGRSEYVI